MWFFGLLQHFFKAGQSRRMAREAARIASLDANQLKEYKAINKERTKFLSRFFQLFSASLRSFSSSISFPRHSRCGFSSLPAFWE
jgi:hypothetical protein